MIVTDTSVIYALLDRAETWHARVAAWYAELDETLVTTPLVLAEADHLASARAGGTARTAFRRDVESGAYEVEWWPSAAVEAAALAETYADTGLSITDASLVLLAARLETVGIATLDERHFRAVRPISGGQAFRLLPADA